MDGWINQVKDIPRATALSGGCGFPKKGKCAQLHTTPGTPVFAALFANPTYPRHQYHNLFNQKHQTQQNTLTI